MIMLAMLLLVAGCSSSGGGSGSGITARSSGQDTGTYEMQSMVNPEPTTIALFGLGTGGLLLFEIRRRMKK